jgi:uncharacterized RDD family membrane protein YckC
MSDLVTGDAVVVELRLARTASRGLAFVIDLLVQIVMLVGMFVLLMISTGSIDDTLVGVIMLVTGVAAFVGYPVLFETLSRGRTLGKMALGLRVVREDGGPIRFRQALVRGLAGFFVDFWILGGAVAVIVSLCSAKSKRVGDFLAGTVVIRERLPAQMSGMIAMPPQLAAWAAGLDVSGLPDYLALAVRQYLGRFDKLSPSASYDLGEALATEVSQRIGAPVPWGVPVGAYLAAVLAQRRAWEQARLGALAQPMSPSLPPPLAAPVPSPPVTTDTPFVPPS